MIRLGPIEGVRRVLLLGAHCDDIEIGCIATAKRLLEEHPDAEVCWVVFGGADQRRAQEARQSAQILLRGCRSEIALYEFRDAFFPFQGAELKDCFERIKRRFSPDMIFTHYREDAHQDHRLVCELTWNTFRNHFILEYEIPKYDGDLGRPNVYAPVSEAACRGKVAHLTENFPSQVEKHWFKAETFQGLMRIRGLECASPSGYAEAFHVRKVVL